MSHLDIIRAWKDEEYRNSLSEAEKAMLPPHPAGAAELSDADLGEVGGGYLTPLFVTIVTYGGTICYTGEELCPGLGWFN